MLSFTTKHRVVVKAGEEFDLAEIAYETICRKHTKPVCTYVLDDSSINFMLSLKNCTVSIVDEFGIVVKEFTCSYFVEKLKEMNE
jgi:hypothetical protein